MITRSKRLSVAVAAGAAGFSGLIFADFDQWRISEIFTSADALVQYVELESTALNQGDLAGLSLTASDATGQQQNTITIANDLSGDTSNRNFLIATQSFVALTGLTPDLLVSDGFLFTEGGSINFANGIATIEYSAMQLPKNGVQAINGNAEPVTPGPTNFAGLSATVSVATNASFDAAAAIMVLPVLDVPGTGIARVAFDVILAADLAATQFVLRDGFYLYAAGILAGNTPAEFQADGTLHTPRLVVGNEIFDFNLSLLSDAPVVFGNPVVLGISNLMPTPEPQPSELQQSIERGRNNFAVLCSDCHGATGLGNIGPNLTTSGFNTFAALRAKIDGSMPSDNPLACRDNSGSSCATDIANFVSNVFQGQ